MNIAVETGFSGGLFLKFGWMLAVGALILAGCSERVESITIRPYSKPKYEIDVAHSSLICGGPCGPPHWPRRYVAHDYLYVDSLSGTIVAKDIILTHERGMLEYPWPQSNLRGEVRFSDHQIAIDLQVPWYEDGNTIKQFDPYDGNTDMAFQMESATVSPESR